VAGEEVKWLKCLAFALSQTNMSSADFKRIILAEMHTYLKAAGFRKKGAVFAAEQNDTVLFIQLQNSLKSTRDFLVVTVNLGIFSRVVAEKMRNTHEPNILEAHWRERIGHFTSNGSDKWWDIQNEKEARSCGAEITNILVNRVFPRMRSLASAANLKSLWLTGESPGLTDYERKRFVEALEE
jgi:hypothetical protein